MDKMLKVLRSSNGITHLHRARLSTSSSLFMFKQPNLNAEWQQYKNLYMLEKNEKKKLEEKNKEVMAKTMKIMSELEKADEKLEKLLLPEVTRSRIKEVEDIYCPEDEVERLKKDVEEIPVNQRSKELTKRIWLYILKNHPDIHISRSLTKSEDSISVERFAENVATVSEICEKVYTAEITSTKWLPKDYELLNEKLLVDTMRILSDDQPSMLFKDLRVTLLPQVSSLIKKS